MVTGRGIILFAALHISDIFRLFGRLVNWFRHFRNELRRLTRLKRSKEVKAKEETVFKSVFIHFRHIIDHPNKHLFYEDFKKFNLPSTESQELRKFLTLSRTFSTFHWRYWIKIHLGPKIHSDRNYMGKYRYNTYHTWIYMSIIYNFSFDKQETSTQPG